MTSGLNAASILSSLDPALCSVARAQLLNNEVEIEREMDKDRVVCVCGGRIQEEGEGEKD